MVNSYECAPGLKITARSEDGILEAVELAENPKNRFFLGVQWHPEMMAWSDPTQQERAVTPEQALEAVKADLKPLNSSVEVSQEEHDEVVAVKAMFLNEDYR